MYCELCEFFTIFILHPSIIWTFERLIFDHWNYNLELFFLSELSYCYLLQAGTVIFFNHIIPQCWLLFWLHSTEVGNPLIFLHRWSATVCSWATSCWCFSIIVFRKCSVLLLYSLSHLHVMLYMQLEVCSHFIKAWLWSGISKGWNYSWILSGYCIMDYKSSESFPTCLS